MLPCGAGEWPLLCVLAWWSACATDHRRHVTEEDLAGAQPSQGPPGAGEHVRQQVSLTNLTWVPVNTWLIVKG